MTAKDTSIDCCDWSLLGLLSILWGGSFFFNGVVLEGIAAVYGGVPARGACGR